MNTDDVITGMKDELRGRNFRWEILQAAQNVWVASIVNANDIAVASGTGPTLVEAVTNASLKYFSQQP